MIKLCADTLLLDITIHYIVIKNDKHPRVIFWACPGFRKHHYSCSTRKFHLAKGSSDQKRLRNRGLVVTQLVLEKAYC